MTNYEYYFGTIERTIKLLSYKMNCKQCPMFIECFNQNIKTGLQDCEERLKNFLEKERND